MKGREKGFTLIEMMLVIVIIGIMAAVAIPVYNQYVAKARVTELFNIWSSDKPALASFHAETGKFPRRLDEVGIDLTTTRSEYQSGRASGAGINNSRCGTYAYVVYQARLSRGTGGQADGQLAFFLFETPTDGLESVCMYYNYGHSSLDIPPEYLPSDCMEVREVVAKYCN